MQAVGLALAWMVLVGVGAVGCRAADQTDRKPVPVSGRRDLPGWFGLPKSPPQRIAGVLRRDGEPTAGRVQLRMAAPDPSVWLGLDAEVGPDGTFDFGELRVGAYTLLGSAPGHLSRVVEVNTAQPSTEALNVFVYPCKEIKGVVTDEAEMPLAGVEILTTGIVVATTDRAGTYAVCLTNEDRILVARRDGYVPKVVETRGTRSMEPFELHPATTATGRVVDQAGLPMAGVAVQPVHVSQVNWSHGTPYDEIPLQVETDASGAFAVGGLNAVDRFAARGDSQAPSAKYTFRVIANQFVGEDVEAEFEAGNAAILIVRPTPRPSREYPSSVSWVEVHGRVTHNGKPLPDVLIGDYRPTRSKLDGSFVLMVQEYSSAWIGLRHPSGIGGARELPSAMRGGAAVAIDLADRGRIEGIVLGVDGKPLSTANVEARARQSASGGRAGTDAIGLFSMTVESGRTFDLKVSDYHTSAKAQATVRVPRSGHVTGLRIQLQDPAAIIGTVRNARGQPEAGVSVLVPTYGQKSSARPGVKPHLLRSVMQPHGPATDARGTFAWTPGVDGPHAIVAVASDGRIGAVDVYNQISTVDIRLQRPGAIKVVCRDFTPMGADFRGGSVSVAKGSLRLEARCGETIEGLEPGRYRVTAKAEMGRFVSSAVQVRAGRIETAVLRVLPAGLLKATVVNLLDGKPIPRAKCKTGIRASDDDETLGDPGTQSEPDGYIQQSMSQGDVVVYCEDDHRRFIKEVFDIKLGKVTKATLAMVPRRLNAVELEVAFDLTARGALLKWVSPIAHDAGLRANDIVTHVDGVAVAGLGRRSVRALAFQPSGGVPMQLRLIRNQIPKRVDVLVD